MLLAAAVSALAPTALSAENIHGIRLVRLPSPSSPLVTLRLVFQTGAADDQPGKEGLAALTAAMLGEGSTAKRTWAEVLDALYPMAAEIHYYGDKDAFVFTGTVHRDNLEAFADLLAEQILTPRFSDRGLQRASSRTPSTPSPRPCAATTTRTWASRPWPRCSTPAIPMAIRPSARWRASRATTLDDVKRFYAEHFTRERLHRRRRRRLSRGLPGRVRGPFRRPARRRQAPPAAAAAARRRTGLRLLHGREAVPRQCHLPRAPHRRHPRATTTSIPLFVAASYLGEHRTFNGVLMLNMRQKRGLNYGDYAYVENFIQEG